MLDQCQLYLNFIRGFSDCLMSLLACRVLSPLKFLVSSHTTPSPPFPYTLAHSYFQPGVPAIVEGTVICLQQNKSEVSAHLPFLDSYL